LRLRRGATGWGAVLTFPALKRGANNHCAYGAGRLAAPRLDRLRRGAEEISTENEFTKTTKLCIL